MYKAARKEKIPMVWCVIGDGWIAASLRCASFLAMTIPTKGLKSIPNPLVFDLNNTPDLFPSVFSTCVALHIDAVFKGISTLSKKESDRINSIIIELSKIYTFINIVSKDTIIIKKSSVSNKEYNINNVVFNTYHDHRIAMALAALFPKIGWVTIDDPTAVNKSFPAFWNELKKFM